MCKIFICVYIYYYISFQIYTLNIMQHLALVLYKQHAHYYVIITVHAHLNVLLECIDT